jgi:hypothetical protein
VSDFVRNIIRLAVFILLQVYVLNKVPHLHRFISPYLYYLFLLWLPFNISRVTLMIVGFMTGIILDYFMMTPGLHAAACVLVAYLRPFIINILAPKDVSGFSYREPSPKAMGWTPYLVYTFILTIFHHTYMIVLEWLSFGSFIDLIIKVIATTGISMLLIITTELLFPRRLKFRTNTA